MQTLAIDSSNANGKPMHKSIQLWMLFVYVVYVLIVILTKLWHRQLHNFLSIDVNKYTICSAKQLPTVIQPVLLTFTALRGIWLLQNSCVNTTPFLSHIVELFN